MSQLKNSKAMIGLAGAVVILVAALVLLNGLNTGSSNLNVVGILEMDDILNDHRFEGTFVYIGRPTCPVCQEFEPILQETLSGLGQTLAYFETDLANGQDPARGAEILNQLNVAAVPTLVYIEGGQPIDALVGLHQQETLLEFFAANGGLR